MKRFAFDKNYYDKFYRDRATRVVTRKGVNALARFVCGYLKHLGLPVERVLDVGCGLGYWKSALRKEFPNAEYHGVEISEYLCRKHGWTHASIVDFTASEPYDLVICQGVLQYLDATEARAALRNLGRLCGKALYLETLTAKDWEENCDQSVTDGSTYLREGAWYRREIDRRFTSLGGGVFLAKTARAVFYELELP